MAKSKSSTCLIGCGLGCLLLVVLGVMTGTGGFLFVRDMMSGFEGAVETRESLEQQFGEARDFVPAADGSVPAERIEAFLAVRAATEQQRAGIAAFFESIPMSDEEAQELEEQPVGRKIGSVFNITRGALGLGSDLGDFFAARNDALEARAMGIGEYSYIFVVAYYSWLDKSPEDGPGDDSDFDGDFGDSYRRVRRDVLQMMRNQLAALGEPEGAADSNPWRQALTEEIEALADDRWRVPWEDGLPETIAASFAPFRDRLEAAYDPTTNPFELSRMEKRGRFTIQAD